MLRIVITTSMNYFRWTNLLNSQNDPLWQFLRSRPFYGGETKIQTVHTCSRLQPRWPVPKTVISKLCCLFSDRCAVDSPWGQASMLVEVGTAELRARPRGERYCISWSVFSLGPEAVQVSSA